MNHRITLNIGRDVGRITNVVSEHSVRIGIQALWAEHLRSTPSIQHIAKPGVEEFFVVSFDVDDKENFARVHHLAQRLGQDCIAVKYHGSALAAVPGPRGRVFDINSFTTEEQAMSYGHPKKPEGRAEKPAPTFAPGSYVRLKNQDQYGDACSGSLRVRDTTDRFTHITHPKAGNGAMYTHDLEAVTEQDMELHSLKVQLREERERAKQTQASLRADITKLGERVQKLEQSNRKAGWMAGAGSVSGTTTGRMSSTVPNVQAVPKPTTEPPRHVVNLTEEERSFVSRLIGHHTGGENYSLYMKFHKDTDAESSKPLPTNEHGLFTRKEGAVTKPATPTGDKVALVLDRKDAQFLRDVIAHYFVGEHIDPIRYAMRQAGIVTFADAAPCTVTGSGQAVRLRRA